MSSLRGYGGVEMPGINFVPLNVYFDNERLNNIRLSWVISVQLPSLQGYLNTKLILVLQIFKLQSFAFGLQLYQFLQKIFQLNTKPKGKEKDKEMLKYSLFSFLSGAIFSHRLPMGLVLNRRTLVAAAFCETYNIRIVKKYNQFIVFFET